MNELQNIQNRIDAAEKRHAEIKAELNDLRSQLEEKRKAQGAAIVDERDAENLAKEIVLLQAQISGTDEARLQLLGNLRDLQADKSRELRAIAREQADKEKSEILLIEADIYASIVQAANRLPDLRRKRADYLAQLQATGSQDVRDEGHKIMLLFENLRRELPNLLDGFPRAIVADGTLPTPSSIRALVKGQ